MDEKAGVEGSLLNNLMLLFEDKTKKRQILPKNIIFSF